MDLEDEVIERVVGPCVASVTEIMSLTDAQANILVWTLTEQIGVGGTTFVQKLVSITESNDDDMPDYLLRAYLRESVYNAAREHCIVLWTKALRDEPRLLD